MEHLPLDLQDFLQTRVEKLSFANREDVRQIAIMAYYLGNKPTSQAEHITGRICIVIGILALVAVIAINKLGG